MAIAATQAGRARWFLPKTASIARATADPRPRDGAGEIASFDSAGCGFVRSQSQKSVHRADELAGLRATIKDGQSHVRLAVCESVPRLRVKSITVLGCGDGPPRRRQPDPLAGVDRLTDQRAESREDMGVGFVEVRLASHGPRADM
ncbi:MAG: hypothetical protein OXH70_19260 [Acidobacteria bacterium]|nr:hypothetical protein [Acidobacteriota bacterium]MCY3968381.1 hypothetical protein [Acidobacteriota bacterium]